MITKHGNELRFESDGASFVKKFEFKVHDFLFDADRIYVVLDTGGLEIPREKKTEIFFV